MSKTKQLKNIGKFGGINNVYLFEKLYGSNAFLKAAVSALNKLLVNKGIATEQEITDYFVKEMKLHGENIE